MRSWPNWLRRVKRAQKSDALFWHEGRLEQLEELVAEIAMTLLLAAHLLCVNVAGGGPIVGAWLDWKGTRGSEAGAGAAEKRSSLGRYLRRVRCTTLIIAAGTG
jgi:hypothetical protein